MERTISQWAMELSLKGTDKVIGSVDFPRRHEDDVLEIGYILHPDYWGFRLCSRSMSTLIDLAFKVLGLHKIELTCFGLQCPKSTSR